MVCFSGKVRVKVSIFSRWDAFNLQNYRWKTAKKEPAPMVCSVYVCLLSIVVLFNVHSLTINNSNLRRSIWRSTSCITAKWAVVQRTRDVCDPFRAMVPANFLHFRKVLPCVNLFTEKLPEAIFKPVFNLDFFRDFSVETLRRLIQFFMCLWTSYNQQVKKRHLLGSCPIISDVEKCKEAIKQIKYLCKLVLCVSCSHDYIPQTSMSHTHAN